MMTYPEDYGWRVIARDADGSATYALPAAKWCITCRAPLAAGDPDYCELCDLHREWRREDAEDERSR
jgi:hypothetical protein